MKVLAYYSHNDIREEEWPKPEPGLGEVRVAIKSVGICGSDISHYQKGPTNSNQAFVFGHEAAGLIDSTGPDIEGLPEGTVVAIEPNIACGKCRFCLTGRQNLCLNQLFMGAPPTNGALSEFVIVPIQNIIPVKAKVSFAEIALAEPFAIGLHTLNLLGISAGDSVAIMGAGGVGLAALIAAKLNGARIRAVADKIDSRLKVADSLGAENLINVTKVDLVDEIMSATGNQGVDFVIEATGDPQALETAIEIASPGGKIAVIGIPENDEWRFSAAPARRKELMIVNVRRSNHTLKRAIELIEEGIVDLSELVSHKFSWREVEKAFELAESKAEGSLRVMLEPADNNEPFYL